MPSLEIPQREYNPALVDPYNPAMRCTWQAWDRPENAPSPEPITIATLTDQAGFSAPIDLTALRSEPRRTPPNILEYTVPIDARTGLVTNEIPDGLEQFHEALGIIAGHEQAHYLNRRYKAAKLMIQQTLVHANTAQRGPSTGNAIDFHRDSADHSYIVSDVEPTLFVVTSAAIDAWKLIKGTERKKQWPPGVKPFQAKPYEIAQSNILSLHCSPFLPSDVVRTFLRLAYTYSHLR